VILRVHYFKKLNFSTVSVSKHAELKSKNEIKRCNKVFAYKKHNINQKFTNLTYVQVTIETAHELI
jgi:hypothetical protein